MASASSFRAPSTPHLAPSTALQYHPLQRRRDPASVLFAPFTQFVGGFMRQKLVLLVLVGSLFHPGLASAQQTGSLSGKITATDGAALPGVTVEVRADVLPGPRTAVTGPTGDYRLPALPPGNYTVKFTLSGMQAVTRQAQVQLLQDTVLDAQLGVQGVTEAVTVTASATLIDRDTATHQKRLVVRPDQGTAGRPGIPRPDQTHSRRAVHAGRRARPERGRQRPGQRLPIRRRQRDLTALRHALGRTVGA